MNTSHYIFSFFILPGIIFFNSCSSTESKKIDADSTKTSDTTVKHNAYVFSDSTTYSQRPVDTTFAEPISGMVEDANSKKIYVKIFPSRDLKACGLALEEVENGHPTKEIKQAIAAIFSINREFSGNLMIKAYNYEKKLLGSSTAKVKGLMGDRKTVNFPFTSSTDFSLIDYCTLGFEE